MRLVNKSKSPNKEIEEMVDFCAKPLGIKTMTVKVYSAQLHHNYWGGSSSWKSEINIATGINVTFPWFLKRPEKVIVKSKDRWEESGREIGKDGGMYIQYKKKPGYVDRYRDAPQLSTLYLSKDEFIIHLLAHELRHQWQRKIRPMKDFTYTARHLGSKSYFRRERDAEAFALKMVRLWRKSHASLQVYPEQPDQINADQK